MWLSAGQTPPATVEQSIQRYAAAHLSALRAAVTTNLDRRSKAILAAVIGRRVPHALLAHRAQPVQHRAADIGAARAQRPGLEHALAAADAAVHVHLDPVADGVDDFRQR